MFKSCDAVYPAISLSMQYLFCRRGSTITDTELQFNVTLNVTAPAVETIASTLKTAIENGTVSLNISVSSINVTGASFHHIHDILCRKRSTATV